MAKHKYLFLDGHEYSLGPKFLVTLPDRVLDGIVFPDFSLGLSYPFLIAVVSITLVQGIESLLSTKAVDKLDPWKRQSDLNKDLSAVAAGSSISGMIGGLPMIAEIVRSSANVNNGGRTGWANFFHGLFLLVFVLAFPTLIHSIPLAALPRYSCTQATSSPLPTTSSTHCTSARSSWPSSAPRWSSPWQRISSLAFLAASC
jgi:MFS superfamily sulfate permease-like transporter